MPARPAPHHPPSSPADALAARPVRLTDAAVVRTDTGGRLTVPLGTPKRLPWLFRPPAGATKTFELDAVGLFVWDAIDGQTSVEQIIGRLAERFRLNLRTAQVPTLQFLRTLMKKGLVGVPAKGRPMRAARQIALPTSKAVEIAWKSIRLRLSRSLLVTSAIVLALAFFCSILTTQALTDGMRRWADTWPHGPEYAALKQRRDDLDTKIKAGEQVLRFDADQARPAKSAPPFKAKDALGGTWDELRATAGTLPLPAADLDRLLTARPDRLAAVKQQLDWSARRKAVRQTLGRPEDLKAAMAGHGVPTTPAEIAADRVQTRWVISLALLVAFVGILNAMLMSVTERFREIGTMKCLGALDGFIVKLFLLESLFQGAAGTTAGIAVGLAVSFAMAAMTYGPDAFVAVPWPTIGGTVGVTLVVGVLLSVGGAILPALQAARMEPIAAMRVEA